MTGKIKHLRWYIAFLLFLVTVINYVDRQTLAVTWPVIRDEFKATNTTYANVANAFMACYATFALLSGPFFDRVGARIGFTVCVGFWSVACMLHALARSAFSFGLFRALLGMGEGGNWPGAVRVISEWFPPHEKAFAVGMFSGGASIGAVLAPPVIGYLTLKYGWRWAYIIPGVVGLFWLIGWLLLFDKPEKNKWLTEEEQKTIFAFRAPEGSVASTSTSEFRWLDILRYRQFWGFALCRFFGDTVWMFMVFWFPNYLNQAQSFGIKEIALFAWIPFLTADLGSMSGGFASGFLIKRLGWTISRARKTVMAVSGIIVIPILFSINQVGHVGACIALISFATFVFQAWTANMLTIPADVFPRVAASATAMGLFVSVIGTLGWNWYVGFVTDKFHSFGLVFGAAGIFMILAVLSLLIILGKVEPVVSRKVQV